jgi:hypothetical protein
MTHLLEISVIFIAYKICSSVRRRGLNYLKKMIFL